MNAIPAIIAGVKRIVMINPGYKGKQNPAVLYAAKKCKIKEIYSIGGPSAIAAVSYGTKKIKIRLEIIFWYLFKIKISEISIIAAI